MFIGDFGFTLLDLTYKVCGFGFVVDVVVLF